MATALFIGRFQPFHNGHLHIVKRLSEEYGLVIIGIGSSEAEFSERNPFTKEERKDMITKVMDAEKIDNFEIVFIPDFDDDFEWIKHIRKSFEFDDCYSGNEWTKRALSEHDCSVCPLEDEHEFQNISSTEIREMIKNKEDISDFVPKPILEYIKHNHSH